MAGGYQQAYGAPNMPAYQATPPHVDVSQIVVPDKAVGAIIGAGGSMIKQIMEDSNAYVTVSMNCHCCFLIFQRLRYYKYELPVLFLDAAVLRLVWYSFS